MHSKKPGQLERKYSVDSLRYMTSKSELSGNTKEKRLSATGLHANGRTESVDGLSSPTSSLPERINRRAEIVAAVTRRLYSHGKKNLDDSKTVAITPVAEVPQETVTAEEAPPQSPVLEIPAMTKIRLQEISRKMLAKRRRIIADTQTDFYESTTRVKHVYTLTDKISCNDASVLTDEHEDLKSFGNSQIQVRRVKEMATLTDKLPTAIVRFKDATCVTEDYKTDVNNANNHSETLNELISQSQNALLKESKLIDESTNTINLDDAYENPVEIQTSRKLKDICCEHRCKCCGAKLESSRLEDKSKSDKNVVSITLPEDLLRITLETPSNLESKITVVEDHGVQSSKVYRDSQNQTDFKQSSPINPYFRYYHFFHERPKFPARTYSLPTTVDSRFKLSRSAYNHDFNRQIVPTKQVPSFYERYSPTNNLLSNSESQSALKLRNDLQIYPNKPDASTKRSDFTYNRFASPRSYSTRYANDNFNKLISLYDGILLLGRKYEESFDTVFDAISEEVKINVSKRLTELKRVDDVSYGSNRASFKPWNSFKK